MTQILTLLISALQLLTLAQNSPNLPQSFRDSAIQLANYSIQVAQNAIANQTPEIVLGSVPQIQPLPLPINNVIITPMEEITKEIVVVPQRYQWGYELYVAYKENGKLKSGVNATISGDGEFTTIIPDAEDPTQRGIRSVVGTSQVSGTWKPQSDYNLLFTFRTESGGEKTITIEANGITKSVVLNF